MSMGTHSPKASPGCAAGAAPEPLPSPPQDSYPLSSQGESQSRFWEGDVTKHFSVKKRDFQWKGGCNSVNQGFGKDSYRKVNSAKRFGPFTEPPDSENWSCCPHPLPGNQLLESVCVCVCTLCMWILAVNLSMSTVACKKKHCSGEVRKPCCSPFLLSFVLHDAPLPCCTSIEESEK